VGGRGRQYRGAGDEGCTRGREAVDPQARVTEPAGPAQRDGACAAAGNREVFAGRSRWLVAEEADAEALPAEGRRGRDIDDSVRIGGSLRLGARVDVEGIEQLMGARVDHR